MPQKTNARTLPLRGDRLLTVNPRYFERRIGISATLHECVFNAYDFLSAFFALGLETNSLDLDIIGVDKLINVVIQ